MKGKTICRRGPLPPAKLEVENPIRGPVSLPHSHGVWLPRALSQDCSPNPLPTSSFSRGPGPGKPQPYRPVLSEAEQGQALC